MEKTWYLVSFYANMDDEDKRAMNKCFYDAMHESMGISECSGLDIFPDDGMTAKAIVNRDKIRLGEQCLVDNGVDADEASTVLQAIGYILMDIELYPETQ